MRNFFENHGNKMIITLVIIILFIVLGLSLIAGNENLGKGTWAGDIVVPVQKVFKKIDVYFSEKVYRITHISDLVNTQNELKQEIAELKQEIHNYKTVVENEEYLENEFEMLNEKKYEYIESNIVAKDPGTWFNRFVLDKGENAGVVNGSTVVIGVKVDDNIYDAAVVGRIIETGKTWSKVISIVDKGSSVSFINERTGAQGIIEGSEDKELNGFLFDVDTDVRIGDKIYTSKTGGHFEDNLYIGEIKDVEIRDDKLLKTIMVQPKIDFKKLSEVYIIQ